MKNKVEIGKDSRIAGWKAGTEHDSSMTMSVLI